MANSRLATAAEVKNEIATKFGNGGVDRGLHWVAVMDIDGSNRDWIQIGKNDKLSLGTSYKKHNGFEDEISLDSQPSEGSSQFFCVSYPDEQV